MLNSIKNTFLLAFLTLNISAFAQRAHLPGLYLQNLPAYAPSLTGAGDYVHIQSGFRKQWLGFKEAPQTAFLNIHSPITRGDNADKVIKNKLFHIKNYTGGTTHISEAKLGIGGFVSQYEQGPYKELDGMFNFAVHVPISKKDYLSFGTSAGLSNARVDLSDISVEDEVNDPVYTSYIRNGATNTALNINASIAIHSEKYFLTYSMLEMTRTQLAGTIALDENRSIGHHILGGYKFVVGKNWEIFPNALVRIKNDNDPLIEGGIRSRFKNNLWMGASYRSNSTFVGMIGLLLNETISFSYSYVMRNSNATNINNGSHEITLGVRLFNIGTFTSFW